jgi:hypothetical protein
MALRICPVPAQSTKTGAMEPTVMAKCFLNIDNSDNYSKEPKFGMKLRNLDNKKYVWYDEVHRRLMGNYRQIYMSYSAYTIENHKNFKLAKAILDTMNKYISPDRFPLYHDEESQMAILYKEAGDIESAKKWANMTIKTCNEIFNKPALRRDRVDRLADEIKGRRGTYKSASDSYMLLGDYTSARNTLFSLYDLCMQAVQELQGNTAYQAEFQQIQKNVYDILGNVANIDQTEIGELAKQGKKKEALDKAQQLKQKYQESKDNLTKQLILYIDQEINKIEGKTASLPGDTTMQ